MDGNGRWAKAKGLPRVEGHRRGVQNVLKVIRSSKNLGIKYLTLYAFSAENWNRPKTEVKALMFLLESFLKSQLKELHENNMRFRVIGNIDGLPPKISKIIHKMMEETKSHTDFNLTLALNYGARQEIIEAVNKIVAENPTSTINWEKIQEKLYTKDIPDPDLIIRTSGEYRLSNFLLLQSAYSEFYFSKIYWPDFSEEELISALNSYKNRQRRFGKTGDQLESDTTVSMKS